MLELFESHDIVAYLMLAGLLLQAAALIGIFYFLHISFSSKNSKQFEAAQTIASPAQIKDMRSGRLQIAIWLTRCARRKEAADEDPHVKSHKKPIIHFLGGFTCQLNYSNGRYPLS